MNDCSGVIALLYRTVFPVLMILSGSMLLTVRAVSDECSVYETGGSACSEAKKLFRQKVITWNVNLMADAFYEKLMLSYFGGQEMNNPLERAKLIADVLEEGQYDIIVLEEFVDEDLRAPVEQKLIDENGYYHSQLLGASYFVLKNLLYIYNGGVMIFTRQPIVEEDELVLSAVGLQRSAAIGVKYVKLKSIYGNFIHIFAVHLQSIQHGWDSEHESLRRHASLLRDFKQSKKIPADDIVLFVGDFNANAGNKSGVVIDDFTENHPS